MKLIILNLYNINTHLWDNIYVSVFKYNFLMWIFFLV
jgi:hypothetical protein